MPRSDSFDQAIADAICERLADGESLSAICRDEGMPHRRMVARWLSDEAHGDFLRAYTVARDIGLDHKADELLEMVENLPAQKEQVDRARLQVDTMKWYLSKLAPKRYGERLAVDSTVEVHDQRSDGEIIARLVALAKELGLPLNRSSIAGLLEPPKDGVRH